MSEVAVKFYVAVSVGVKHTFVEQAKLRVME